jgi:hypothetical protein
MEVAISVLLHDCYFGKAASRRTPDGYLLNCIELQGLRAASPGLLLGTPISTPF